MSKEDDSLLPTTTLRSITSSGGKSEVKENEITREKLCTAVQRAGETILSYRGPISDTGQHEGHELSTVDEFARTVVNNTLDQLFPDADGIRRYELRPVSVRPFDRKRLLPDQRQNFIIDEIDGTTNLKRELANLKPRDIPQPQASTCITISKDLTLGGIQAAAVFTFDTRDVYSVFRANASFFSYKNDCLLRESDYAQALGDTMDRVMLVGYSNSNREEKGGWENALWGRTTRVYEGCRASSIDIINIIRGRYDAYTDPRALWGEQSGAMLQTYDVAAVIPIALGLGFTVSDVYGKPWQKYGLNDALPLVISRSARLHHEILEAIKPLLTKKGGDYERITTPGSIS